MVKLVLGTPISVAELKSPPSATWYQVNSYSSDNGSPAAPPKGLTETTVAEPPPNVGSQAV